MHKAALQKGSLPLQQPEKLGVVASPECPPHLQSEQYLLAAQDVPGQLLQILRHLPQVAQLEQDEVADELALVTHIHFIVFIFTIAIAVAITVVVIGSEVISVQRLQQVVELLSVLLGMSTHEVH